MPNTKRQRQKAKAYVNVSFISRKDIGDGRASNLNPAHTDPQSKI